MVSATPANTISDKNITFSPSPQSSFHIQQQLNLAPQLSPFPPPFIHNALHEVTITPSVKSELSVPAGESSFISPINNLGFSNTLFKDDKLNAVNLKLANRKKREPQLHELYLRRYIFQVFIYFLFL
jgi:hypothetical protein